MKIHLAQRHDYDSIKQLWQYSFGFSPRFLSWSDNILTCADTYIAEDDNAHTAAAASSVMTDISLGGKTLRASYLCGCATAPEYRSRGVMRSLVTSYVNQMCGSGVPISICVPFDYSVLARYGWKTCYMYKQYELKPERIPPYTVKGRIQRFGNGVYPYAELSAVYNAFTSSLNGFEKRSVSVWKRILEDLDVNFGGSCAVYYNKENVPSGYMLYLIRGGVMSVYEMAFTDKTAADSLYAFIRSHSAQLESVVIKLPENDITQLDFCDSRTSATLRPFAAARITNVSAALSYVCEKAEEEIKLQVIDRICEDCCGVYSITKNGIVKTEDTPDAIIDIGTLTQLFAGFLSVDDAVYMNSIAGNADKLKQLFDKKHNYINMLIL